MWPLQEYNNITKIDTDKKRWDARGFGKQHQSKFQANPNGWLPLTKFKTGTKSFRWSRSKIPPCSSDLNPIQNFFNLVVRKLRKQLLDEQIESETYDQFRQRVKAVMLNISVEKINKIIESMSCRIVMVIKENGCRIKY